MNQTTTTIKDLCCIFCCPPWPSKVVAKLAFLPPNTSYDFVKLADEGSNSNNNNNYETSTPASDRKSGNGDAEAAQPTPKTNRTEASDKDKKKTSSLGLSKLGKSRSKKEKDSKNTSKNDTTTNTTTNQDSPDGLTYHIPPEAEYRLQPNTEAAGYIPYEFDKDQILPSFVKTKRGNKLACTYIKYTPNKELYRKRPSKFVILFSHGNAVDIGQMPPFYIGLAARLKTDIFSYDYSGYWGV